MLSLYMDLFLFTIMVVAIFISFFIGSMKFWGCIATCVDRVTTNHCRVTCRDWFQLSLKEGLTVFRDQVWTLLLVLSSVAWIGQDEKYFLKDTIQILSSKIDAHDIIYLHHNLDIGRTQGGRMEVCSLFIYQEKLHFVLEQPISLLTPGQSN